MFEFNRETIPSPRPSSLSPPQLWHNLKKNILKIRGLKTSVKNASFSQVQHYTFFMMCAGLKM